jgi:hypothetical protein
MPKIIYPSHYSETDQAIYDDLLSRGETLIGKKLSENERFLLDLSAKITINQMKGYDSGYSEQEISEMRSMHKQMANAGIIETPPDKFYDDMIELSNGTTFKNPLSYPAEYYYEQNQQKPQNYDETMDKLSEDTNRLQIPVNVD